MIKSILKGRFCQTATFCSSSIRQEEPEIVGLELDNYIAASRLPVSVQFWFFIIARNPQISREIETKVFPIVFHGLFTKI